MYVQVEKSQNKIIINITIGVASTANINVLNTLYESTQERQFQLYVSFTYLHVVKHIVGTVLPPLIDFEVSSTGYLIRINIIINIIKFSRFVHTFFAYIINYFILQLFLLYNIRLSYITFILVT